MFDTWKYFHQLYLVNKERRNTRTSSIPIANTIFHSLYSKQTNRIPYIYLVISISINSSVYTRAPSVYVIPYIHLISINSPINFYILTGKTHLTLKFSNKFQSTSINKLYYFSKTFNARPLFPSPLTLCRFLYIRIVHRRAFSLNWKTELYTEKRVVAHDKIHVTRVYIERLLQTTSVLPVPRILKNQKGIYNKVV